MKKTKERKVNFDNNCKWLFEKPMYHRGKFDNVKVYENTMSAFKESMKDESPFEFDVQLTSDGEVICFHDDDLKRLFNRNRLVREISYKRINKLRDDLQVPLFKDVLKEINGKVELMIEIKHTTSKFNHHLVKKVYELLKDYKGKYVIVSFNSFILKQYRSLDKNAFLGKIGSGNSKGINKLVVKYNWFSSLAKPDFYSYDIDAYDAKLLGKYHKKGYKITGWALKDKNRISELDKDFDNYIVESFSTKEVKK